MPRVLYTVVKMYYKVRLHSSGTYAGVRACKRLRRTHMPHVVCQYGRTHLWIHHLYCKIQNATMSTRDQQTLVDQSWETPPSIDNVLQDSYRNCPAAICEPLLQFIGNMNLALDHGIKVPISMISTQIYWIPNKLRDSARLFAVSWYSDHYPYARGLLGRHLQENTDTDFRSVKLLLKKIRDYLEKLSSIRYIHIYMNIL